MTDNKKNVGRVLWLGAIIPVLLVIGLGFVVLNQFNSFEENNKWVAHTHEVLIHAGEIQKIMVDLETGQRGFIITGKDNFLGPFYAGKDRIFREIKYLKNKVNDNPLQIERLDHIEMKVNHWFKIAGYPEIEARRKHNRGEVKFNYVSDLLIAETGKTQVDDLRAALEEFILVEKTLVEERAGVVQTSVANTRMLLIIGVALIVLIIMSMSLFSVKFILRS